MLRNKRAHHTSSRFRTTETEVLHVCHAFIHFLRSFVHSFADTLNTLVIDKPVSISNRESIYLSLMPWFAMIFFFFVFFVFQFNFFVFIDKTFDLFPSLFIRKDVKKNKKKTYVKRSIAIEKIEKKTNRKL